MKKIDTLIRLAHLAKEAERQKRERFYISLNDHRIKVASGTEPVTIETDSPAAAVEALEEFIRSKAPVYVVLSYSLSNLIDLYPKRRPAFPEPVITSNIAHGDYLKALNAFSLRQLLLYNHVLTMGGPCLANEARRITYTDDEITRAAPDEARLFEMLAYIVERRALPSDLSKGCVTTDGA